MDEILINTTTQSLQHQPAVCVFAGGQLYFVVWADGSDATIKGRFVTASGNPSGSEFIVNTPTPSAMNTNRQLPTIAATGSGPVVAWVERAFNIPPPFPHIKLQRFNSDGQKSGPEVQVSTNEVDPTHRPAIAGMIDGGFLVAWVDAERDRRIRAQRFSGDGARIGNELQVNTSDGSHESPVITRLAGVDASGNQGNYVVAWRSDPFPPGGGALTFRIFTLNGTPVIGETRPNLSGFDGGKAMTFLDDGRFVIAHIRNLGESDLGVAKSAVHANVFEPNGASANIPIFATAGGQEINSSFPALAALPGGRFLITWVQKRADTFATTPSVRAKLYSTAGASIGAEVQVDTAATGERFSVCVAGAGGFGAAESAFFAWTDTSLTAPDRSDSAVRGRALRVLPTGLD